MSKVYRIRVTRVNEQSEYNYASGYDIEADDHASAELKARKQFCNDFGAPYDKTEAYTFNKLSHEK